MGAGRHAIGFKAASRLTVLLVLGVSTGCLSGGNPDSSVASSAWTTKTPMPTARSGLAVGVVNVNGKDILYAVGGNNGATDLATVEAYDPGTNKWTTKTPMPTARSGLAIGVVNGILYAFGGSNGGTALTTVEAYDTVADSWTTKASMSTARYGLGVGVVNGQIYTVGGFIAPDQSSPVEAYDPLADGWVPRASMPFGRMLLGVGVVNNILYGVGGSTDGSNNLPTVEAYDYVSDTWTTETPMSIPRGGLAVGVNDGILYAVGGQLPDIVVGSTVPKTLEAYNPATNSWTTKDPMPTGRTLLAAGVVNGILYAVGGDDQGTVETFTP